MILTPQARWLLADKDKRPEYRTLMANERIQAIIRMVRKTGKLPTWSYECTKYNNPRPGEDNSVIEAGPREDGHYDVEGHSAVDVHTRWNLRLWHPGDLWSIAKHAREWASDTWDLYHPRYLMRHPKAVGDAARWMKDTWPLSHRSSGWTWTLDSMKVAYDEAAYDKAEEIVEQRRPCPDGAKRSKAIADIYPEIRRTITIKEVEAFLVDSGMNKISDRMWVSAYDPTNFVYDEAYHLFDMKDGWSDEAVAKIIGEWWLEMLGEQVKTFHDPRGA